MGLCIGIAYLMIYFIPTLDLTNTLVPASILTTVLIVIIGIVFKSWVAENARNARILLSDDDDYEDDDDEPEPPTVTESIQIVIIEIDAKNSSDLHV